MPGTPKRDDPTTGEDSLNKAIRRNLSLGRVALLAGRGMRILRQNGPEALARAVQFRWRLASGGEVWPFRADIPLRKDTRAQRKATFAYRPLISVVVPLYRTPPLYLKQLIQSVTSQSYPRWELVLADGSGPDDDSVERLVAPALRKEERIRYKRLAKNAGIAGNTNAGFAMATGDYLCLLDHDDVLAPGALYEVVSAINATGADFLYSDEVVLDDTLKKLVSFHYKPDFGPDTLRGCNYITHLSVFSARLLQSIGGGEDPAYDGSQDFDLILRLTENAKCIHHIPKVLYYWRQHALSTAKDIESTKPQAIEAGRQAIAAHLERTGLAGSVAAMSGYPGAYRVQYEVWGKPLVSVLIPSSDHTDDLARCLASLYQNAGWAPFEVLVLDNNSHDEATESFYAWAEEHYDNLQVFRYPGSFNFSAICNFGAARAKGEHLLLLNNDTEIESDGFLREMLSYSQRPDVGAVGALLWFPADAMYPRDEVQHAGLFIGIGGTAGVSNKRLPRGDGGSMYRVCTTQNLSAVTGAALMVKRGLYDKLGGLDEEHFAVAFNDVDFCLRLREEGLWNVYTPFAHAYHYESKSRGLDTQGPANERYQREEAAFKQKYATLLQQGDPFYNPHLTLLYENYGYR